MSKVAKNKSLNIILIRFLIFENSLATGRETNPGFRHSTNFLKYEFSTIINVNAALTINCNKNSSALVKFLFCFLYNGLSGSSKEVSISTDSLFVSKFIDIL
ncbi:hypothetical protein BpHYR1_017202 [Brachionus plicatilis]|uniref:Uncharacterized protein n=1 Tax=Brachionus plicatilis TaxID=10195 RepID=A0A3M7R7G0_BRAPC|nr:hypothetical protein BpHYR1_017202 [Brachionus plicatilis]